MCLGMPSISPLHGDGARDGGCGLWCAVLPRPSCARLGRCHPTRAYVARDAIGFWEVPYLSLTSSWCLIVHHAPAGTCAVATLLTYCGAHGPVEGGGGELGERDAQLGGLGLGLG